LGLIAFFPCTIVLKKYPKISGYLDRISKIWIMKKFDIQSIQVSMYPKKTDIHVSKYPCIQASMISKYPIIRVSKENRYPRYPCIRIYEKSGIRPSLVTPLKIQFKYMRQNRFPILILMTLFDFYLKANQRLKAVENYI
jgi:hypothetical protein